MHDVREWFFTWLEYHQFLHPHRNWIKPEHINAGTFYAGWIETLEAFGATEELCRRASRKLQEASPKFLNNHLPDLKSVLIDFRKSAPLGIVTGDGDYVNPEQVKAATASHECPECNGTGWATRRAYWPSFDWMPTVDMFCRCPHGRWRRINDPDLAQGKPRNHDDLQAHPELWNSEIGFSLWSARPTNPDVDIEDMAGQWRYLKPGEAAPEGARTRLSPSFIRDWNGVDERSTFGHEELTA